MAPQQGYSDRNNMVEYVETQFDSIAERPIGDVDSLVLSWLSYWRIDPEAKGARTTRGIELRELYDTHALFQMTTVVADPACCRHLLAALVASPRFRHLRVANYVEDTDDKTEKQFSAMTLRLPGNVTYVAFRGTDSTVVGWKEDFNLAFEQAIPSQLAARGYLEKVARLTRGPIYVGGHSKGGNLAVFAAMTCKPHVRERIEAVFSHDGPGFTEETLSLPSWAEASHLIRKTLPRSSVIGMLFERQEQFLVVESSSVGIMQHDPFSWVVDGTDFCRVDELSMGASLFDQGLNDWVSAMTSEEREHFIETLFSILKAGDEPTFSSLRENWTTTVPKMLSALADMSGEDRDMLGRVISALVRSVVPNVGDVLAFADPTPETPGFQLSDLLSIFRRPGETDEQKALADAEAPNA